MTKDKQAPDRHFFIVSLSERGFWSNTDGWVFSTLQADSFTYSEVRNGFNMPLTKDRDATIFEMTDVLKDGDWLEFSDDEGIVNPLLVFGNRSALHVARECHQKDGELEIDIPTSDEDCEKAVSRGSPLGIYVKAWRFIYWPEFAIKGEEKFAKLFPDEASDE